MDTPSINDLSRRGFLAGTSAGAALTASAASMSAAVYASRGLFMISSVRPDSTILPSFMTMSLSHMRVMTARSWETITSVSPRRSRMSMRRLRTCACTETSRALVGSSA